MSTLFLLTLILSSYNKDDNNNDPQGVPHKVQYKIIGSNGVNITTIVYMKGKIVGLLLCCLYFKRRIYS
ncbi:hypothetical protein GCM10022216_22980 [Sphingobacterium kyonggiense]|uniref:Uncharacterized protein n=1 Tax=Sphingobacterium kyonggiense TaxID=714075 RepID=A0ABP7YW33_9SPHI